MFRTDPSYILPVEGEIKPFEHVNLSLARHSLKREVSLDLVMPRTNSNIPQVRLREIRAASDLGTLAAKRLEKAFATVMRELEGGNLHSAYLSVEYPSLFSARKLKLQRNDAKRYTGGYLSSALDSSEDQAVRIWTNADGVAVHFLNGTLLQLGYPRLLPSIYLPHCFELSLLL